MSRTDVTLQHEVIDRNGTLKAKVIARDAADPSVIVDSEVMTVDGSHTRLRFAKRLCERTGRVDAKGRAEAAAVAEFDRLILGVLDAPTPEAPPAPADAAEPDYAALLKDMPPAAVEAAEELLSDPKIVQRISDDIALAGVAGERELGVTLYVVYTSRLRRNPLAAIIQGHTSSGKSYVVDIAAGLMPPEAVVTAKQMTPQALFHMPPGSLRHRLIVAGERSRREDDDSAEATRALREMLSSGRLDKLMPVKAEGGIVTQQIHQDGPIAFVESTTLSKIFDEDLNRCLLLGTDEREEQTQRIIRSMAAARAAGPRDDGPLTRRHHALQRVLSVERLPVVIPYAAALGDRFPSERPEARRAFGHVLNFIETLAHLHLRQRARSADGSIVAAADDYRIARRLLAGPMSRLLGGAVSDAAKRFNERLGKWVSGPFNSSDCYRREDASDTAVRGWLAELHHAGVLTLVEARRGTPTVWKLNDNPPELEHATTLPPVKEVCGGD